MHLLYKWFFVYRHCVLVHMLDGMGERLYCNSDDDRSSGGWRETMWTLLAWWRIIFIQHLWGENHSVELPLKSLVAFTLFYLFFLVCLRWILCPNTSGVKTSWFVVSTWRTFRLKRHGLWPSFICWAGLHKAFPPPHAPCWTSAGTATTTPNPFW